MDPVSESALPIPAEVEVAGHAYIVDRDLTRLISSGVPAPMAGCRHGRQVIKQENLFLVSDDDGNLYPGCNCGMGLYAFDTRFLSGWVLRLEDLIPTLLSFSAERNFLAKIEFMNQRLVLADGREVPQETLYFSVSRSIGDRLREQVRMVNYNPFEVRLHLSLQFHADYADIFAVRGLHTVHRGLYLRPEVGPDRLTLAYFGADKLLRQTQIVFEGFPDRIDTESTPDGLQATTGTAHFTVVLPGRGAQTLLGYSISVVLNGQVPGGAPSEEFSQELMLLTRRHAQRQEHVARVSASHEIYNVIINRSMQDLASLTTLYQTGPYPSAGIPWFTAPFGRDGIITALQTLLLGPELAIGTLRYLAANQAKEDDPYRDAEPGKIMHERRFGELANLGSIPHTPYYGSVDSTPLFLILLSETFRWTGDLTLVRELWDAVEAALMWLEGYGDLDGDGFVEYQTRSSMGLFSQGWKDSGPAIIHPDATVARPPIALAEVQGYVYDAKRRISQLCYLLDLRILGDRLAREAAELKEAFDSSFWSPELGYYALALDAEKRQVLTKTSNPGHCLWSGIVPQNRAQGLADALLAQDLFSGWGIRTIASSSPVYNPLCYHNGTVWPHDTAIIAMGLAKYGFKAGALKLLNALFDAALHFEYYRLPELFCGFSRHGDLDRPVPYPVACSPQAWAAGTTFMLLQAALGLHPDGPGNALWIVEPRLPDWLDDLKIESLRVAGSTLDLQFLQTNGITTARVLRKDGNIKVLIEG